ncbi:MAG: hypothetical protein SGPRY_005219 [Prymnesium sp.]
MRCGRRSAQAGGCAALVCAAAILCWSTNLRAVREATIALTASPLPRTKPSLPHASRVLVTGGAGFIGYHLSRRLHAMGMVVTALDNMDPYYSPALKRARAANLQGLGVQLVQADMCDTAMLRQLLREHRITHVASMAAQAGVRYSLSHPQARPRLALSEAYVRANIECFVSLLEALRSVPSVPLIYASSSSIYGTNTKIPFAESDRTDDPSSLYAATKKADEAMAHVYHSLYGLSVADLP